VSATLLPHFISHASRPAGWIATYPLSLRIKQVPVAFALGNLYQGSAVSYGLIGFAVVAAVVIAVLIVGASNAELRGAAVAAGTAGVVLLIPLLLALAGHDYYIPRALIAAWMPLAVVLAAACTGTRVRAAGAALAVVTIGAFIWSWARIESDQQYQRPDWRGVASALGDASGPRAVVTYDGGFGAVPIALYVHGTALAQGSTAPVAIRELDVVGSPWQSVPKALPHQTWLLGTHRIGNHLVARFALGAQTVLTPAEITARAQTLLGPGSADAAIVVQRALG
jgi:hypothetical protein